MHVWLLGPVLLIRLVSGVVAVNDEVVPPHEETHLKLSETKLNWSQTENGSTSPEIPIITFKWNHVETPFLVVVWILVAGLAKLGM